jgi:hypothetical protein
MWKLYNAAFMLGLSWLLVAGLDLGAQEKTPGKDKGDKEPKTKSKFTEGKAIELKLKDGKAKYSGELTAKDPALNDHFYKIFTIKLEAGKTYKLEQRSDGDPIFDSFLYLEDAEGKELAKNDDIADGNLDSRIVYKAAKAGTYRVITSTFVDNQTGKFILEIVTE